MTILVSTLKNHDVTQHNLCLVHYYYFTDQADIVVG